MQTQSLTVQQPQALTAHQYQKDQIELIKKTYAKGATDTELALFVEVAQRKGLDIFSRQIHLIKRKNRKTGEDEISIQTGIDGYRLLAERTGKYEGQVGPFWCDEKGEWKDVWLSSKPPAAAKVGILKSGCKEPFYAVALFREYAQTDYNGNPIALWARMPANQLSKCSEALALRKAFPSEMSGIYTQEEVAQAENAIDIEAETVEQKPPAKTPRAALKAVPKQEPITIEAGPVIERATEPEDIAFSNKTAAELGGVQVEDDPLPEFTERDSDETAAQIESERLGLIEELRAASKAYLQCFDKDEDAIAIAWEQYVEKYDVNNQTRGWLRNRIEMAQAATVKARVNIEPVVLTDTQAKSLPGQLPDGRKKMQRENAEGKPVAVLEHEGSHMKGRQATNEESTQNLNYWIEHWRTHPRDGQDLATIRAKVARVVGEFHDWSDLNGADLAKAIRVLQEWRPDLDTQTSQKGAKK